MYPKGRIDALTDGLFGVAMTILVLDVSLPDGFEPRDAGELSRALLGLWPKFYPYALSFYVLGSTWLANTKLRSHGEFVAREYVTWWLLYLLVATCLPFSTEIVGRYAHLAPAVWLYAFNMAVLAGVGYRLMVLLPDLEHDEHTRQRRVSLIVLLGSSAISAVVALVDPGDAVWAYLLNLGATPLSRWIGKRSGNKSAAPSS